MTKHAFIIIIMFIFSLSVVGQIKTKVDTLVYTGKKLAEYKAIYKWPNLVFIRTAFNSYLDGTYKKKGYFTETALSGNSANTDTVSGMRNYNKSYYKSKFIVLGVRGNVIGRKYVDLLFRDHPDRVFEVWVCGQGKENFQIRNFYALPSFTNAKMGKVRSRYYKLLHDNDNCL